MYPSIFETFNAKSLKPEQVAKSFVVSDAYISLTERSNSIIIGPRGSGKTTLLKMLQPQALDIWGHPDAEVYREKIDFLSIFVPADIAWAKQTNSLFEKQINDEIKERFRMAIFTTHVLRSLIKLIDYCSTDNTGVAKRFDLSKTDEVFFVEGVARAWELEIQMPTIKGIRIALVDRMNDFSKHAEIISNLDQGEQNKYLLNQGFMNLNFIAASDVATERIHDIVGKEYRWAFLFDELEIIDDMIINRINDSLRGSKENYLFKMSYSPFSDNVYMAAKSMQSSPIKGHDFKTIPLWYAYKEDAYDFCHSLVSNMLIEFNCNGSPEDVLGDLGLSYDLGENPEIINKKSKAIKTSFYAEKITSLSKKDPSFKKYLDDSTQHLSDTCSLSGNKRAQIIRKPKQIIAFRDEFLNMNSSGSLKLRSRKYPKIYVGTKNIFAIVEGNPRLLIGLLYPLILRMKREAKTSVPFSWQAQHIYDVVHTYRAMLQTRPINSISGSRIKRRGLLALIDVIGESFKREVYDRQFNPEPPLTFTITDDIPKDIHDSIGYALNVGAIIFVTKKSGTDVLNSLSGKSYRLSYLLATHYHLPLIMTGKSKSIKKILRELAQKKVT